MAILCFKTICRHESQRLLSSLFNQRFLLNLKLITSSHVFLMTTFIFPVYWGLSKSTVEVWKLPSGLTLIEEKSEATHPSVVLMTFLSLGWETVLEGRWTISRATVWRCERTWKFKGKGQVNTILMEHFNILFHKSKDLLSSNILIC